MYPNLWTVPGIDFHIRTYGFVMAVGFVIAMFIARRRAKFSNLDPAAMTTLVLIGMVGGIVGAPLMYFLHHGNFGGREVLGGVALGVICSLAYLRITHKSILGYLDAAVPALILAMGIGRIGCLMFGCCWGGVFQSDSGERSAVWAVRFPYSSPLYVHTFLEGNLAIPESLLWIHPVSKEKEPIPPSVLERDIDSDEMLKSFAAAAYRFSVARKDRTQIAELTSASKAYADAKKTIGKRDILAIAAGAHLAKLNAKSETSDITWHDLKELSEKQRTPWVHPTQLYDFVALVLLFFVLSHMFWRRYRRGTVVAWAMILYPINRVLQEIIRSDNPHDMPGGLTISQFASIGIFVFGIGLAVWIVSVSPKAQSSPAATS